MSLSVDQVAQLAYAAGFRGENLVTMTAVAMRESRGNPRAHNRNPRTGDDSYGLWQINMIGAMGPARRRSFGITSNEQLFDPATNARAAFILSDKGTSTYHWTGYRAGAGTATYAQWLPAARAAAQKAEAGGGGSSSPGALDYVTNPAGATAQAIVAGASPLEALGSAVGFVTDPANWRRVGYVLGAVVLLLMGVAVILSDTAVDVVDQVT